MTKGISTKKVAAEKVAANEVAAKPQPMQAADEAGATKQAKMVAGAKHKQEPVQVSSPSPPANLAANVECENKPEVSSPPPSAVLAASVRHEGNSEAVPEEKTQPFCDEAENIYQPRQKASHPTGTDRGWSQGVPVLVMYPQVAPSLSDHCYAAAVGLVANIQQAARTAMHRLLDRLSDTAAGRWLQDNHVRVSIMLLCISMLLMLAILLTMVIDIEELYVRVGALQEKVQGSVSAQMGGAAGGLVVLGAAAAVAARKQRGTVRVADVEPLIELA